MDSSSRTRAMALPAACTGTVDPGHPGAPLVRLVGRRLRELRHAAGWGQSDLEARLEGHIGRSEISYLENGRRRPTLATLASIARAFDVEPAVLLLDPRNDVAHRIAVCLLDGRAPRCLECWLGADSKAREV